MVGAAGVSPRDFEIMYIDEIRVSLTAAAERYETQMRDAWERMRMLASMTVAPHVSKPIEPRRLIPLPWDTETRAADEAPKLTKEQRRQRMQRRQQQLNRYHIHDSRTTEV